MSDKSPIEWTDATWNPTRGCSRKSPGCLHCYAERVAMRFSAPGLPYHGLVKMTSQGPKWTGKVAMVVEQLDAPLAWREPRRVFVDSMSDLFHVRVSDDFIAAVFAIMASCHRHTFQILTKCPERAAAWYKRAVVRGVGSYLRSSLVKIAGDAVSLRAPITANGMWPLRNVWFGVSAESQDYAQARIPLLLKIPAAVRFVSAEPLLGPIDFNALSDEDWNLNALTGLRENPFGDIVERQMGPKLDWVIAGGESGPGARPSHPEWIRGIQKQCAAAGTRFLFKQWGAWQPFQYVDAASGRALVKLAGAGRNELTLQPGPVNMRRMGKKAAGRTLDGRTWDEFPS